MTYTDPIDILIGRRIRRQRRLLGMSQGALAAKCGIRFQQIQKYECAHNRVSAARLWQIAGALGVPIAYFFEGLGDRESEAFERMLSSQETLILFETFAKLGKEPRSRLLALAQSMHKH